MHKQLLIIIDHAPLKGEALTTTQFKETIDAALGIAAFGIGVSIWFCGAGVNCLEKSETFKIIELLNYYDIDKIYASREDLDHYQPNFQQLSVNITPIEKRQLASIIHQHATILRMN